MVGFKDDEKFPDKLFVAPFDLLSDSLICTVACNSSTTYNTRTREKQEMNERRPSTHYNLPVTAKSFHAV